MFTQCPDCGTVFRVSAQALRAAQGTVRCGICSSSFNALEALSEHPVPQQGEEPAHDDTITVEELPGNEVIELSGIYEGPSEGPGDEEDADGAGGEGRDEDDGRTDEEPVRADPAGADEADESAQADESGESSADSALEFHGSIEDLERLFVAIDSPSLPPLSPQGDRAAIGDSRIAEFKATVDRISASDLSGIEVEERDLPDDEDEGDIDPAEVAAILAFRSPGAEDELDAAPEAASADEAATGDRDQAAAAEVGLDDLDRTDEFPILVLDEKDEDIPGEAHESPAAVGAATPDDQPSPGILIPLELRRDTAAAAEEAFSSSVDRGDGPGPRRWPWVVVLSLLLLALGAQAVHYWRADLVRNPLTGPWLLRAYGTLGLPLAAPTDLAAFELRQLGAASDAMQSGRLKLRASIVNLAAFAQPYPLLRLSLQDRFGSTIGVRDLQPAEYLPGGATPASNLMASGQRIDAEVVFVDPGRDAVGYELDVCTRDDAGVRCSADLARP